MGEPCEAFAGVGNPFYGACPPEVNMCWTSVLVPAWTRFSQHPG